MNKKCCLLKRSAMLALVLLGSSGFLAADDNLLPNGNFEKGSKWPDDWGQPKSGATLEKEGENHFVRLVSTTVDEEVNLYVAYKLKSKHKAYELSYRVRVDNLKVGTQPWFDARIVTNFKDDSGEVFPSPAPVYFRKNTSEWVEKSIQFKVPEGATKLEILAGLFQVVSGTFDIDDIVLKPIDPELVK